MNDPKIQPELAKNRNRVAGVISFAHAIKHIYNSGQSSLIMPEIKMGFGLSGSQYGSLSTAASIAWWIANMIAGYIGDRFSHKAGLSIATSLIIIAVSFLLLGFSKNYITILVVMFFAGFGPAIFHPPALGELSRRFPDRTGFAISLHGMAANIGEVLGPFTVAIFLQFMLWQDMVKASFVPAILTAILVLIFVPTRKSLTDHEMKSAREYFSTLFSLLSNKIILILVITTAVRSVGEASVGTFLSIYLRENLQYSVAAVALILSLSQIAGIISQPIMGAMSDKFGRKPILITGSLLSTLAAFSIALAPPGIGLFIAILIRGSFTFSLHHIVIAAGLDSARGVASSTVVAIIYASGIFGAFSPVIAGYISDIYGIHSAFLYGGVVLIIPTVLLYLTKFPKPLNSKSKS